MQGGNKTQADKAQADKAQADNKTKAHNKKQTHKAEARNKAETQNLLGLPRDQERPGLPPLPLPLAPCGRNVADLPPTVRPVPRLCITKLMSIGTF